MLEAFDPIVLSALQILACEDSFEAGLAGAAFRVLTGDRSPHRLTRHDVELFCWYRLPVRWDDPPAPPSRIAPALARLLDGCGMESYARVCTSRTTRRILAAYERDRSSGVRLAARAVDRSPVTPPDGRLGWSGDPGPDEWDVYTGVAAALEIACAAGRVSRRRRDAVARSFLDTTGPDGRTRARTIAAERVRRWAERPGDVRRGIAGEVAAGLVGEVALPSTADGLEPLLWLLDTAGRRGLHVEPSGMLAPDVIAAGARRFGLPAADGCAEIDLLHGLLLDLGALGGLVRRHVPTPVGWLLLHEPLRLWRWVAYAMWPGDRVPAAATELLLASLLRDGRVADRRELDAAGRELEVGAPDIDRASRRFVYLARPLGLATLSDDGPALTPSGTSVVAFALRAWATAPVPR